VNGTSSFDAWISSQPLADSEAESHHVRIETGPPDLSPFILSSSSSGLQPKMQRRKKRSEDRLGRDRCYWRGGFAGGGDACGGPGLTDNATGPSRIFEFAYVCSFLCRGCTITQSSTYISGLHKVGESPGLRRHFFEISNYIVESKCFQRVRVTQKPSKILKERTRLPVCINDVIK
jgi:hypothetical protein